ncbi:MAG: SDR family NAD(P)-dependent oxidoreductase [Lachnospiraceae bacterium]|nr:SDR family NAD(P)-dependent oxidoreductase [Lachnospiraceae bacterium]
MNIAIITGASSGMGKEFAIQLAPMLKKTNELWLIARKKENLEDVVNSLKEMDIVPEIKVFPMDITEENKLNQFAQAMMILNPKISVLVNCAGVGTYGAFDKQSREETMEMVRLNVLALTQMTKICLPYMHKGSKIIQVASGSAFLPQPQFAVYAATKSYVYSFGRALAKELKPQGIVVTTVCPGPVETPFLEHAYGRYGELGKLKKMTMADTDKVVAQAIKDCKKKKEVSVYGLPMKLLYGLSRGVIR